jgi:hypothetical protein
MARPILTVGLPKEISFEKFHGITTSLSENLDDYHIITFQHQNKNIEFNTYYEKDHQKKTVEQLKKIILERMNKLQEIKK